MTKKTRNRLPDEVKSKAVADYVSGAKTAAEIARELGVDVQYIYQWRAAQNEKARGARIANFAAEGITPEVAEKLIQQQEEIEAYQKTVAQQAVIIDLLKKLQTSGTYPQESELTGLIKTTKKLDRKGRHV